MARDFSKAFYASAAWQKCRSAYIRSVGGLCEDCLKRGLFVPGKVVHHVQPLTPENVVDPAVTLAWDNLRLVCQDCHAALHRGPAIRYKFTEDGSLMEM